MPPADHDQLNRAYYDRHARPYFERTLGAAMGPLYRPFLDLLPPGARILDAGCGPGRDLRAFAERGFDAVGIDASVAMVRLAREHAGVEVHHLRFLEIPWRCAFDGVWACASLLHVPEAELAQVLTLLAGALRPKGTLYASFGLGRGEREANGRRFTFLDGERLGEILVEVGVLEPLRVWESEDGRTGGQGAWFNALLRRRDDRGADPVAQSVSEP